jgi:hypothetical protein
VKESLPAPDPTPGFFKRRRLWLIVLVAVVTLALIDIPVRSYLEKPGLARRNEGLSNMAVPYMLDELARRDGTNLAFVGTSALHAYDTCLYSQTGPLVAERLLREQGFDVNSFNLALSGNITGENAALTHAAIKAGADLVVFEVIYPVYGGRGIININQPTLPKVLYQARDLPKFDENLPLFNTRLIKWKTRLPGLWLFNNWKLLQNRGLIIYSLLGRPDGPAIQLGDKIMQSRGLTPKRENWKYFLPESERPAPDFTWHKKRENGGDLLRQVAKVKQDQVVISPDTKNMKLLSLVCKESKASGVPVLFYTAPFNREIVEEINLLDLRMYDRWLKLAERRIESEGCLFFDLRNGVEPRHFTDYVHMNRNGHAVLGQLYVPMLVPYLQGDKP